LLPTARGIVGENFRFHQPVDNPVRRAEVPVASLAEARAEEVSAATKARESGRVAGVEEAEIRDRGAR
jgi:hypothetical protein